MKSIFEGMGGTYRQEGDLSARQIWPNAAKLLERASSCPLLRSHNGRAALESPGRNRQALQCSHGSDDSCYEKTGRCHRSPESGRPDGMGAPHEQHL